jgi:integrase
MAHYPKPFFRAPRGLWYVQIDGKQINLGPDKKAAFKTYHGLMQQRGETPAPIRAAATPNPLVLLIVDEFLDWCEKHRAPDTYRWYKDRLQSFCKTIDAGLTVDQLRPHHVQKWVDNYGVPLKSGSRRNLIASVKRAMKWGEEQGYIDRSPIAYLKKPGCGRKEQVVTPEQYRGLLARYPDQEFRDLLTITWETGCRPQESLRVEARHVDIAASRWVFPASESKGKKIPRVVYLTPTALEITKRLMEKHPVGPLLRNTKGEPWTPYATNCRFQHVRRKTGIKYSLYAFRHTWMTRMLMHGVDAFTVATLAGHSDPSMLAKHYAHLSQAPGYLAAQAMRIAG